MRFYVYQLIDPRDLSIFYIGKGQGKRINEHVRDARNGIVGLKCDLIREVLAAGLDVIEKIVKRFSDEDSAYAFERQLIARIGLDNLTNIAPGGREITSEEYYRRKEMRGAANTLSRMLRKLAKYEQFHWYFGGKWHDISKTDLTKIYNNGIKQVIDELGKSEVLAIFAKYNVFVENKV